jgi:homeobox protein ESX1
MAAARTRSRFDREDAGPRNDVYTGLLTISLVAMLVSCLLLYLDYSQYGGPAPKVAVPAPATPRVPGGGGGGGAAAAAPAADTSLTRADAPAKLPEPLVLEAPKLIENAPAIVVATDVSIVPPRVTPAVAETPILVPEPTPPVIVQAPAAPPVADPPPAPPVAVAMTETVAPPQLPEPPPLPKLRSNSPPAPTPAPAPAKKPSDTDPPPLPKSIRQLPPH